MERKLVGQRAYLCGSIDRDPTLGAGWRNDMTDFLTERGVVILDPLKKDIDLGIENTENIEERKVWKANGEYDKLTKHMKAVRVTDLRMVDIADFLVVNINTELHACGTYEEAFWANRCKKPVLIHSELGKKDCPDWMFGTFPHQHIFDTWEELRSYLDAVHTGKDTRHFKRWMFFDLASKTTDALSG